MEKKYFIEGLDKAIQETSIKSNRQSNELRPFVCDGNPLDCEIFTVGLNPASNVDWEPFWDKETGIFDKTNFIKSYQSKRIELGKRLESTTRKRINILINEIKPYICLETNIYSYPSKSREEISPRDKLTLIFSYLLNSIHPKVIHLEGEDAINYFEEKFKISLSKEKEIIVDLGFGKVSLFTTPHFTSRQKGLTDERIKNWGRIIKLIVEKEK